LFSIKRDNIKEIKREKNKKTLILILKIYLSYEYIRKKYKLNLNNIKFKDSKEGKRRGK